MTTALPTLGCTDDTIITAWLRARWRRTLRDRGTVTYRRQNWPAFRDNYGGIYRLSDTRPVRCGNLVASTYRPAPPGTGTNREGTP